MMAALLGLISLAASAPLHLEPPLDPISGVMAAVAYWSEEGPPGAAVFTLRDADDVAVWSAESAFSAEWRRAVAYCDTSALADGAYVLVVRCGGQEDRAELRLRQGRTRAPGERPFRERMLWMPMTGCTDADMDDAVELGGYDTLFTKVAPHYQGPGRPLDYSHGDALVRKAQARGMKSVVAWLLWTALPPGAFSLRNEDGTGTPNRIDPCDEKAMALVRHHAEALLDHYLGCADVIGLAPTWGIYGEAGYAAFNSGYSEALLAKFNRWRIGRGEAPLAALPTAGDAHAYLLLQRFRFEYLVTVWGELNAHLRHREPNGIAIGAWQEIYNGHMYQLALSECPGADFAINEMCFPWGTTYDQPRAIGETMGMRYKCGSFEDYRDYYTPLIARKWAEGQQAIGCQLSLDYAEKNYSAWPEGKAAQVAFHQWEDRFGPCIKAVRDTVIVPEAPEVAYIQMTYPAACYPDPGNTITDLNLYEVVLRMYGIAYERIPITRLSRLTPERLARYKLIVAPDAWYLDQDMWDKLEASGAHVMYTGGVMQFSDDGKAETSREADGLTLRYGPVPGGKPRVAEGASAGIRARMAPFLGDAAPALPEDMGLSGIDGARVHVTLEGAPLLAQAGRRYFLTNRLLYACAYDPGREPPSLGGSADVSANEGDPWGKASSANPNNRFGEELVAAIAEEAGVLLRIAAPLPRHASRYLGDHVERVNVTGNMVVNQDSVAHTIDIRCRRKPENAGARLEDGVWTASVTVGPYGYVALAYEGE